MRLTFLRVGWATFSCPTPMRRRDAMQELIRAEGGNFTLAAWDWRYYAEKLRKERCDLAEGEIEPYLELDRMIVPVSQARSGR